MFVVVFVICLFCGHTQQCSEITPLFVLREHYSRAGGPSEVGTQGLNLD